MSMRRISVREVTKLPRKPLQVTSKSILNIRVAVSSGDIVWDRIEDELAAVCHEFLFCIFKATTALMPEVFRGRSRPVTSSK